MNLGKFGRSLAVGGFAIAMLAGVQSASAQNRNEEYREWQQAQRRAQEEYRDYQRTRSRRDYRDWQQAQRRAQQERTEYQRSIQRGYGNTYGNVNPTRRVGWYRINRGGTYYNVDQRQYQLLQNAVNQGYQQGYNSGVRDRSYNRSQNYYYNDNVYRSGTYGYQSYVERDQYQYYFQQGFQRGYQDGINSRQQYGYRTNNGLSILGSVLGSILQLAN
ncbi:MAG: hypothetical protein PSX80_07580 [bacterium]|nr:hypothetical protein [bacterium]